MGVIDLSTLGSPLPAGAYTTYRIAAPLRTHFRVGTCQEANCPAMIHGWRSVIDERTPLGAAQAHAIRTVSKRKHTEEKGPDGLTVFAFPAGQRCFEQHMVRIEREELFVREGGDWRGNPLGVPRCRHSTPGLWLEDFAEHQERLAARVRRG